VKAWVKNAWKGLPAIVIDVMEEDWWVWWKAINLKWRKWDTDGRILQEESGAWGALNCPGQNRFLNVIVCLKWWAGVMETVSDAWKRVVADVRWVMKAMQ
jgi:hypothetical protein